MKKFLVISLLILAAAVSNAQNIPVSGKFGNISKAELEMTSYAPDTSAAAVALYVKTDVSVFFDASSTMKRKETYTYRYKVLKESGKDCADFKLICLADHGVEYFHDIKASAYNLDNGKTVVSKLNKKMIYTEKYSDKYNQVSFSVPDVKVGSVVEVQFSLSSLQYWDIGTLWMQGSYPVNYGEIVVSYADFFRFNRLVRGHLSFNDIETETITRSVALSGGEAMTMKTIMESYTAKNLPAQKIEGYCYYPNQSRLGVDYELKEVSIPGAYYKDFSSTWEKVDEQFVESGLVNECRKNPKLITEVKNAVSGETDEKKVIETVRKIVLEHVHWNEKIAVFPNTEKAIKEGEGDSADICGVAASVLNAIDYTASPVLIKSRNKGILAADYHVSTDSFNALVLEITTPSGAVYYTDIVRPYTYLNVLPSVYRVDKARVLAYGQKGRWVDLSNLGRNFHNQQVIANITADGKVSGKLAINASDGFAMQLKDVYLSETNKEEYLDNIEKEFGIEVTDYSFKGDKDWSPKASLTLEFTSEATVAGDFIYVKPFLNKFHSESDFKEPQRESPIDFPFPEQIKLTASFTIPDGYAVAELPTNTQYTLDFADSRMLVKYALFNSNTVMVSYVFSRNATRILKNQYEPFRKYWEQLCGVANSTIVLKKI